MQRIKIGDTLVQVKQALFDTGCQFMKDKKGIHSCGVLIELKNDKVIWFSKER